MERTEYIQVRVTPAEKAALQAAADSLNETLSEFIRIAVARRSLNLIDTEDTQEAQ